MLNSDIIFHVKKPQYSLIILHVKGILSADKFHIYWLWDFKFYQLILAILWKAYAMY